jgi:hypothetical protein
LHQKPKPRCKHILAVNINAPRPGAYTCNLCGFNTDEWVQMLMHRGTCPKRPDLSKSEYTTPMPPPTLAAVIEMRNAATRALAEPDALERFTVRRKFKFTD